MSNRNTGKVVVERRPHHPSPEVAQQFLPLRGSGKGEGWTESSSQSY